MFRATTWQERRWLFRRVLPTVLRDRSVCYLGLLGGSLVLLAATIALATEGPRSVPTLMAVGGVGGILLSTSLCIFTTRISGAELVQQLLRLEKCGCCGHPKSTPACRFEQALPRASRRFTCTECGASWAGGLADFGEDRYEEAA